MKDTPAIKQKLMSSWDQMKICFPVVVDQTRVRGDAAKEEFLGFVDGVRSAEEISEYFTLDASEAHLVFSDLLNTGAIRFIDDTERLAYLKQRAVEIKRNMDFLLGENNRLTGEECYLNGQIKEREREVTNIQTRIPDLTALLDELETTLKTHKDSANDLRESNSELIGITRDMRHKENKIKTVLEKMEYEYPKIIKKRTRAGDRLHRIDKTVEGSASQNEGLKQKYIIYHDAIDEMRDYFEDTVGRVKDLIKVT
ncbi:MAG: hypothetical protein HQM16_14105 [Deltaproteobacteria bacterium]|nr:hypothetical protein [Deltaproteobacteria bacterium]